MRRLILASLLVLTLAIGIALGAGPLGDKIDEERHGPTAATASARAGSDPLDSALATSVAPSVLQGKLSGQSVAILALPGAATATVTGLAADVVAAGGTVTGTTQLTEAVTAVGEKQMVEALGAQVMAQMPDAVDATLTTYPRFGALLGRALSTTGASAPADAAASTLRETFLAGEFVTAPITGATATLTLAVAGRRTDPAILTGLLTGLRSRSHGLVLTGASRNRDVAAVRDATLPVGTFDGAETDAGRIGTVLLMARQITSAGGSFGASGSDGTLPLG